MAIVPCPQCAHPLEEDDGFCGHCGAVLDPDLLEDDAPASAAVATSRAPAAIAGLDVPVAARTEVGLDPARAPSTDSNTDVGRPRPLDMGLDEGFDEKTDVAPPDMTAPFPDAPAPAPAPAPPPVSAGPPPATDFDSFLEERTGVFTEQLGGPSFDEETGSHATDQTSMMQPQVVLRRQPGVDAASLSPFETHVIGFLDGHRPLARLRKKTGLTFNDLKIAIGMLAERGAIQVVGRFVADARGLIDVSELEESGTFDLPPQPPPKPPGIPAVAAAPIAAPSAPRGPAPAAKRAPPAPAAPRPAAPARDPRASLLLEQALQELRAGKRTAAVSLMHMAAEVAPDDEQIQGLLKSWKGLG